MKKEKGIAAIQIIGTQRSGSNLIRLMLNQLDELVAPHPPHILKTFYPLLHLYGDLNDENNFFRLVEDVCKLVELNPVPWKKLKLDAEDVHTKCVSNSLIEIFRNVYEAKAAMFNASYWCCKSMSNIHFASEIEASGLNPLYIHLYRDGRDVALSFKNAMVGEKHVYFLAKQWKEEQEKSSLLLAKLGAERGIAISYEQLLKDEVGVLKRVCKFLGVDYNPKLLAFYNSEESNLTAESGRMWKNLSKPIMHDNTKKYKKGLTEREILIFESVAGDTLMRLGYKLDFSIKDHIKFSEEELIKFGFENKQMKKEAMSTAVPDDILRRKPRQVLLKDIVLRNK